MPLTSHCSYFKGHTAPASTIAYSPTLPALLISAGLDKKIVLIDTVKQTYVHG